MPPPPRVADPVPLSALRMTVEPPPLLVRLPAAVVTTSAIRVVPLLAVMPTVPLFARTTLGRLMVRLVPATLLKEMLPPEVLATDPIVEVMVRGVAPVSRLRTMLPPAPELTAAIAGEP